MALSGLKQPGVEEDFCDRRTSVTLSESILRPYLSGSLSGMVTEACRKKSFCEWDQKNLYCTVVIPHACFQRCFVNNIIDFVPCHKNRLVLFRARVWNACVFQTNVCTADRWALSTTAWTCHQIRAHHHCWAPLLRSRPTQPRSSQNHLRAWCPLQISRSEEVFLTSELPAGLLCNAKITATIPGKNLTLSLAEDRVAALKRNAMARSVATMTT